MTNYKHRQPAVSGRFYPANKSELLQQLRVYFNLAKHSEKFNDIRAVIVPHAGYIFSGQVAAQAYASIDPDAEFDNIFILAPSHHTHFNGASIYNRGNYKTPLGEMQVNLETANQLIRKNACFSFDCNAHKYEHSVEVQLPFLQSYFAKNKQIIPIICGTQDIQVLEKISIALSPFFNAHNLFVISSDFSHFLDYNTAITIDKQMSDAIVNQSPKEFLKTLKKLKEWETPHNSTTPCGFCGIYILKLLTQLHPELTFNALQYRNSGDSDWGSKSRVVGYWAINIAHK